MADKDSELRVVRQSSDGRRRYDKKGKRALIEAALRLGVSVARLAQEHGINANLLRKWITKYLMEREKGVCPAPQDNSDDYRLLTMWLTAWPPTCRVRASSFLPRQPHSRSCQ
ncbi:transposase [Burkholderia diffusa]|uniref:transposase n=1 Tax=Burkholderia diffusa TaxID=488732 RepID=UPI000AFB684D|nr:transposase [Burkholderia diffusa]